MIETKHIIAWGIRVNLIILYEIYHLGITQSPQDHLFRKSGHLGATRVHKLASKQKSKNLSFSRYYCNQIHYQIGYMSQFVNTVCKSSYRNHTEASLPFISKMGNLSATWVNKWVIKNRIFLSFLFMVVTECITRQVIWVNSFTVYVIHYICITHMPQDHLFQMCGIWVQHGCRNCYEKNPTNSCFFLMNVTKYSTGQVIWFDLFTLYETYYIGTTHRPHDHLFQKWGIWVQHMCING